MGLDFGVLLREGYPQSAESHAWDEEFWPRFVGLSISVCADHNDRLRCPASTFVVVFWY